MPNDIYGYNSEYAPVKILQAKEMILKVDSGTPTGEEYLVQNVMISYQQPVQIVRELSSGNGYYNALPPQGGITIGRIIGEHPISQILGPVGNGVWTTPKKGDQGGRVVTLYHVGGSGSKYTCYGCIVSTYSMDVDANRSMVQENVQLRFGSMSIT